MHIFTLTILRYVANKISIKQTSHLDKSTYYEAGKKQSKLLLCNLCNEKSYC